MKFFFFLLMFVPLFAQAQNYNSQIFEAGSVTPSVADIIKEAERLLPPMWKEEIKRHSKIKITFSDLNKLKASVEGDVLGVSFPPHKIMLSNLLIARPDKLQKVLLHETSHIYDSFGNVTGEDKKMYEYCMQEAEGQYTVLSVLCNSVRVRSKSVSDSELFLDLINYDRGFFQFRSKGNSSLGRSPDQYEGSQPKEYFAVNMEYFLSDPEYHCRRPTLYQYFSDVFQYAPNKNFKCNPLNEVYLDGRGKVKLDYERLYQVHYLLAGDGTSMSSQFGHAMFRLVFCGPKTPMGPECMKDTAYHVVISFRAEVSDLNVSTMDGLTGKYKARLFLMTMGDVIKEYVTGEMRELNSIPIKFTPEQKESFLNRLFELYYGYVGSYYFISNNCAVESFKMLRSVKTDKYAQEYKTLYTPKGLQSYLDQVDLLDKTFLKDRSLGIKKGYYFPTMMDAYRAAFKFLSDAEMISDVYSVEDYFFKTSDEDRLKFAEKASLARGNERKTSLSKFFVLEMQISQMRQAKATKQILDEIKKASEKNQDQKALLNEILEVSEKKKAFTGIKIARGYGIPQIQDVDNVVGESGNLKSDLDSQTEQIQKKMAESYRRYFIPYEKAQENVRAILEMLDPNK